MMDKKNLKLHTKWYDLPCLGVLIWRHASAVNERTPYCRLHKPLSMVCAHPINTLKRVLISHRFVCMLHHEAMCAYICGIVDLGIIGQKKLNQAHILLFNRR